MQNLSLEDVALKSETLSTDQQTEVKGGFIIVEDVTMG